MLIKRVISVLMLFTFVVGSNLLAGPRDPFSKAAKDPSYPHLIAEAVVLQTDGNNMDLANLDKIVLKILTFEAFYYGNYTQFQASDRLSPYEILRAISSLKQFEALLQFSLNPKNGSLLISADQIQRLEISLLRTSILIQRLSIELKKLHEASGGDPSQQRLLFEGVKALPHRSVQSMISDLGLSISRLNTLEKAMTCMALF